MRKKRPAMRGTRPRRYSWTLQLKNGDPWLRWLSREGREGFEYARRLARNAKERRRAALGSDVLPELLTVAGIALDEQIATVTVLARIKQARIDLFGKNLSDSAIDYQLRTRREIGPRECAEPTCRAPLPPHLSRARRYCDLHRTTLARVRRHRGHPAPRPKPGGVTPRVPPRSRYSI
jgi:hypothetical protein